jgi:predicted branched-subunit amino acid permease
MLGSAIFMYTNWQICTLIGIVTGSAISDPGGWGLDFAMVATFIGILVPMVKDRAVLGAISVAAVCALILNSLPNQTGLFSATILGIMTGIFLERFYEK